MLKRRSTWLGGTGALVLVLSFSGPVVGATPPDAQPAVVVDTTTTFEDIDGNGIDDDCQLVAAVANPDAVTAETLTVDANADGSISTTEAAHSVRTGGKNCNHGGYVSWIAHQNGDECTTEPTADETTDPGDDEATDPGDDETTEPADNETTEPADNESTDPDADEAVLVVTTPPDAQPDANVDACTQPADTETADPASAKKDHAAAAAARLAAKAERTLAREAKKAERTLAHATSKADRQAAHSAAKAERAAAHAAKMAERSAAKAKHNSH